jgi:hypothetical protein
LQSYLQLLLQFSRVLSYTILGRFYGRKQEFASVSCVMDKFEIIWQPLPISQRDILVAMQNQYMCD